ncbi:MAG TPA: hypothetical protein VHL53_03900 [Acidimicrobiia bacterium]|nr:hypothetical protein [Acidimicrobiia bacterium]
MGCGTGRGRGRAAAGTAAAVLVLALALTGLVPPASAHTGDGLSQPIFEQMTPAVAGVDVQVASSANYELLVANHTPTPLTFLADSGEPFLRISPAGVEGNFASPTFYASNAPQGITRYPPEARPGPEVPPVWRTIAAQPEWGWYDHRLHPASSYLPPDITSSKKVVELGRWTVPLRYGDEAGALTGRFEFRPPTGSYAMVQKSPPSPEPGLTLQVVSAAKVPAVFAENRTDRPLVVLGRAGEPFARIGPTITEVNAYSPTWAAVQQANGQDPSAEADATRPPRWEQVADAPRWSWLEFRGVAPATDPPAGVIAAGKAVDVRTWTVPYRLGDKAGALEAVTRFVPIAELREQAAAGRTGPGSSQSGNGSDLPLYLGIGLAAAVMGTAAWLLTSGHRRRRSQGAQAKGEQWTS